MTELMRYLFGGGDEVALQLWESQSALFPLAFIVPLVACIMTAVASTVLLISRRPDGRVLALPASLISCIVVAGPAMFYRLTGPLSDSFDAWRRLDELDIGWYIARVAALAASVAAGYGYLLRNPQARGPATEARSGKRMPRDRKNPSLPGRRT